MVVRGKCGIFATLFVVVGLVACEGTSDDDGDEDDAEDQCVEMCERGQADGDCFVESDASGVTTDIDCPSFCEDIAWISDSRRAGCEARIGDLHACVSRAGDWCDALSAECDVDLDEFLDCLIDYCNDHPTDASCVDVAT